MFSCMSSALCFRYTLGQKEHEVELEFSSVLMNYPDRVKTDGEEYKDAEVPILGSMISASTHHASRWVTFHAHSVGL